MKVLQGGRRAEVGAEVLDVLAASESPALATDVSGHIVFWNRGAESLLGRPASSVLGRRCHEVLGGRDVFGNRFCHENCSVVSMSRKGETVRGFEINVSTPRDEQTLSVTILRVPGSRPELYTIVHILQPVDQAARLARALERLGAESQPNAECGDAAGARPVSVTKFPALTEREAEILHWIAAGLQNKEVAQRLGISLATVRNHIHNILEKLDVHSKLEAVSLAFRAGWVAGPSSESPDASD